jgi:hypothetical protein
MPLSPRPSPFNPLGLHPTNSLTNFQLFYDFLKLCIDFIGVFVGPPLLSEIILVLMNFILSIKIKNNLDNKELLQAKYE